MFAARGAIFLFGWLLLSIALGVLARAAYLRWVVAPSRASWSTAEVRSACRDPLSA